MAVFCCGLITVVSPIPVWIIFFLYVKFDATLPLTAIYLLFAVTIMILGAWGVCRKNKTTLSRSEKVMLLLGIMLAAISIPLVLSIANLILNPEPSTPAMGTITTYMPQHVAASSPSNVARWATAKLHLVSLHIPITSLRVFVPLCLRV
jgi:hypothetical protein